ncbi:MAG: hypothetical protein IJZ89_01765 [Clostridia bacterium]|nr:hypothetical protein [Clostridia bacterium]
MRQYLIPENGNFYKANLHVHTTVSDGRMTPEEVKKIYKDNGYSVLAITDHQIMLPHPELDDEDFITITSVEVAKNMGDYNFLPSTHFNVYAKDQKAEVFPFFDPEGFWRAIKHTMDYRTETMINYEAKHFGYGPEELNRVIAECNKQGFLVCFNHPKGSLQNYRDYGGLKGLWGMECYNTGAAQEGYEDDMDPIDDLLTEGQRKVFPIASDDAHGEGSCCGGWVMIKAEALEYSKIMEALEVGDFYASTGIEIKELYIDNGILHIETDGVDEIVLHTPIRYRKTINSKDGEPITVWDCDITDLIADCRKKYDTLAKDTYFRLDLRTKDGKRAHTRAFFLDQIKD